MNLRDDICESACSGPGQAQYRLKAEVPAQDTMRLLQSTHPRYLKQRCPKMVASLSNGSYRASTCSATTDMGDGYWVGTASPCVPASCGATADLPARFQVPQGPERPSATPIRQGCDLAQVPCLTAALFAWNYPCPIEIACRSSVLPASKWGRGRETIPRALYTRMAISSVCPTAARQAARQAAWQAAWQKGWHS